MTMKDPSSTRTVFFGGFDRNMSKQHHQQQKEEAKQSKQASKKISSKLEGLSFISKKHQQSEKVEEKEENQTFLRQKEEQQTNLFESKNTTSNQNKITLHLAKQSSQNMLFSYCKDMNRSRSRNRNKDSNRNKITNFNRDRILSQANNNNSNNNNNNNNNSDQNEDEITLKALVKKKFGSKPKQYWFAIGTILLFTLISFHQLTTTSTLVEAKIHHSKRQAPDQSSSFPSSSQQSSQSSTGRENTNWWNLWWQQYISDAIQPTVRPIVSVSFNGKTISLSDQEQTDSNGVVQFQPESRDVDTNFVLNNLNSPEMNPIDLERNEKLRLISSNLPENTHPFAAKQMMLAQRKSVQQQANWQSVKPTMIQMSPQQRETRPNRQANLNQVEDSSAAANSVTGLSSSDLGIQMRTSMSQRRSNNDQQQQVQQEQLTLKPSTGQVIKQTNSLQNLNNQQQQQKEDDTRFEQQQQNQMVDYSEESEPELENNISGNATSGIEGDDQGRVGGQQQTTSGGSSMSGSEMPAINSVDSSSSSMMLEPQKEFERQKPAVSNESTLDDRNRQQGNVTQVNLMRSKTQSDERPANGPIESQKGDGLSQSTATSSTMSPSTIRMSTPLFGVQFGSTNDTTRRQPSQVTTQARQQPSSKQPVLQSGTMTTTSAATQRPSTTSTTIATTKLSNARDETSSSGTLTTTTTMAVTVPTSTAAPSTSTSPRLIMSTAGDNVDLNETPISISDREQPRGQTRGQQQSTKSTTPTGRIELENGRPATGGGRQQMATTTSARLPTKQTTTGASSTTPSRKSSSTMSTTISTTPIPLSETTQTMRSNDGVNAAQPGMRITGTSTTTSRPKGGAEPARTTPTPISNTSTLSTNQQATETTTMPAGSNSAETTDSSSSENASEDTDDDEDDESSTSPNDSKQSSGANSVMSNATSSSESDDSNDDSSTSSDGESEQDQTTTVSATAATTTTTASTTQPSIQTTTTAGLSRAQTLTESKITTTTQPPALTTIDIERLPIKDQSGPKSTTLPGMTMVMMRTSTPSTSSPSSTLADISRITRPSSTTSSSTRPSSTTAASSTSPSSTSTSLSMNQQLRQQQQQQQQQEQQSIQMPNTNLIMMNLDQTKPSTIGGETAITMPMETLMKMMMMNQIMRENNELIGSTMPISTPEQTTQTPLTTSSDIVSPNTTETSGTSTSQATQQTSVSGNRSELNSTVAPEKEGDENDQRNVSQNADTEPSSMFKKKLQPPPTTRQPSSSKIQTGSGQSAVETSQTSSMQTTTTSSPTTTTTTTTLTTASPTSLEVDGPTQRTMFVNFEPSSGSMMDVISGGREEPKIDLINLDLLPIQRIMNSQSGMLNDKLKNNTSTTQLSVEQQQTANEIMRGTSQTPTKQLDQLMLEVEPGMRLRPPIGMAGVVMRGTTTVGGIQTNNGQVMGSTKTGLSNPSNTMYTIMTSSNVSPAQQQQQQQGKAHSKKPASTTPSEQKTAAIPQAPVKSAPNMRQSQQQMTINSRTMPNIAQQQSTSSTVLSSPSSMSTSFQQQQMTRTTQPVVPFQTTFQTTTTPAPTSNKNSMRFITSSAATTTTNQQLVQTSARPRFMDMNLIELEMEREGSRSTSKTKTEITDMMKMMMMRKAEQNERQQQQASMRPGEFNSDFGAVTTVTTTTTKSPTGLEMEQQTLSNTTTTNAQSSTVTESSTTPRPSLVSSTTLSASSSTSPKQQANLSTVSNIMARTTVSAATTTTASTPTTTTTTAATSTQPTPTSAETGSEPRTTMKETSNALSPVQMLANNQQADNSRNNNNNNNRLDRIQLQQPERRPQQVGTKTGRVSQQAQNKASTSNLTSSFISPKLRTDFNKFSNRVQQQPVRVNDKLVAQQPQKDPAESRQSSVVDSNARVVPTTTQSSIANGMIQNMAIRQFGGANRMSALANQPVPFGRPSAMTIQQQNKQQQQRFELPSFEYGSSIAVRRPDEPLANGQIPNCTLTGKNFCVLTKDYPMNEVRQAVERSFRSVRIMYEELQTVSDQELHKDDFNSTNNKAASGKFACQTQVEMMRPGWAKDEITKEWMLVVNTDVFPQRVRTESCSQPNTPCEFISPFYDSTCQQRYSLHRMIAIDPHDSSRSPQVAVFKFPAGCVCRVNPIRRTST